MAHLRWWQRAIFYQIYPRSFADGNGDGIGDFAGMIAKLDYLQSLGVDALWLSPHFPSPNADLGYDVADYTGVAPEYGTLDDFKRFLDGAHARGMRVVLDLVLNHTSDQHPWFIESRRSRDNPKRDWYIWRDPAPDGGPPNNWNSVFGGSAWEFDPTTGQYYYHFFLKQQPDLNWRNPQVKAAMWQAVRFWLDMGVDGFRLDAIGTLFEDPAYPNHTARLSQIEMLRAWRENRPPEEQQALMAELMVMFRYQFGRPEVHTVMKELRALVDTYPGDRVLIGEDDDPAYYGNGDDELHLVFNFPLMRTNRLTPAWVRANQADRLSKLPPGAWPCNTLGNHDSTRLWSAFGDGQHDASIARVNAALLLTLPGTPVLYYGEEIGMTDLLLERFDQLRDNQAINLYHLALSDGLSPETAMGMAARMTRDRCRTPMQWANAPNAGFSPPGVQTWLPVNSNYAHGVNVADQTNDPRSLLNFYRRLIHLRKRTPALLSGGYMPVNEDAETYLAFLRRDPGADRACLVVLNMSAEPQVAGLALPWPTAHCLFSSHEREGQTVSLAALALAPFEVFIGQVGGGPAVS
ncbi:MAG: alpha-glucosidase [Chloroflexi bacterium]|jgi:alpha-glucosidase|uniref:Glucohydrolase n=1 Tax=Candidatus Thermofonsia Clade 3 bacterium TaxID=2364212 RepID=A0A2M8QDB8_9CHLR|nr:alpha-glucosidase [Candidatus Roseilinea sp. NK_OTU-006]PJF47806.1 MAG: glucohydrolase [Candidatus Thermofonsia Clade 3 bacterium]RMG63116.1 MAG: alpha-glucosidase [Chloroflexota bacterium]